MTADVETYLGDASPYCPRCGGSGRVLANPADDDSEIPCPCVPVYYRQRRVSFRERLRRLVQRVRS